RARPLAARRDGRAARVRRVLRRHARLSRGRQVGGVGGAAGVRGVLPPVGGTPSVDRVARARGGRAGAQTSRPRARLRRGDRGLPPGVVSRASTPVQNSSSRHGSKSGGGFPSVATA